MAHDYVYKKVSYITFGILGPEEVERMSAAKVVTPELYDKEGYPVDGGIMDIRLGVIDPGLRCKTCGEKLKECIGHFGHIELARPIVHVNFVKPVLDCLKSTCSACGKILLQDKDIVTRKEQIMRAKKSADLDAYRKITKLITISLKNIRKCPHCKEKQYSVKLDKPTTFMENDKKLSPIEVRARLERISDDDCLLLGLEAKFARPEWFILTLLPIPPVTMRPSITLESGERSEDDLTHKLSDIIRINQRLFENINAGAPEIIVEDLWELLQYHVTTYYDNTIVQVPPARHRSGQPLRTLTERIKSKEGRFRHNLAGKRVNYTARAVISPDPKIKFNEVGIPFEVAHELTIPERVTEWNIERLKEFIKRGPNVYPGANYVLSPEGKKKKITEDSVTALLEELKEGYTVERHLMDGDVAIFNRQPSLHRMSVMCHLIKVLPGKSFRLNPSVCHPYNADFDGDEMNLHIPQTEEARAEAYTLMQVQTQIMTPKHGLNIIGCVEDSISGNYLLTKNMELPKEDAVSLLCSIGIDNVSFSKAKVSGKEVFSALLPKDFNYRGTSKDKKEVIVKNGELVEGVIDKNAIGEENGVLIRDLYRIYGEDTTLELIGKIFRLGIAVLLRRGFTTGIQDSDLPEEVLDKIKAAIKQSEKDVEKLIESYNNKELEQVPGKTLEETLEIRILQLLNKVRNKIGELVADEAKEDNHTAIMERSGAKGNTLNRVQMAALVGQQALGGMRIQRGYIGRTLSSFKKGDLGPEAHGFIANSYKSGLTPVEFFFHAMTGRDALMDTALRTPKSGYLYRRLANALQDMKVEYDNTVRDANKAIVQFKYGDDGMDVSKSEGGEINVRKAIKDVTGK
ncbi:MAG: DNA-directed RNA polymerase subunit A' [Candidatus Nanoarchaeia archaeon]|nr:DNA-directed RNA polymerase subunit A' [Candidatus Nanoarchaeia archaeon]